jgi:DNA-binding transcriptional ArsR family regulator
MNLNVITKTKMDSTSLDEQTQVLKILTHPARIAILNILRDGEHCVCHMEAYLGFRQSYISQQLAVLREAGIIQDRRDGWNIYYRVIDMRIYDVLDSVQKYVGQEAYITPVPLEKCNCPYCSNKESKL